MFRILPLSDTGMPFFSVAVPDPASLRLHRVLNRGPFSLIYAMKVKNDNTTRFHNQRYRQSGGLTRTVRIQYPSQRRWTQ
jgi:hypothetical protein